MLLFNYESYEENVTGKSLDWIKVRAGFALSPKAHCEAMLTIVRGRSILLLSESHVIFGK